MRKFGFLFLLLFFVGLGGASTAFADTVKLIKLGDQIGPGAFAGPYQATLNGNPITMVCVSFDRHVTEGQTWQVTVNDLTAAGVANALYGDQAKALSKYQQAAWLTDQLSLHVDQKGDIQTAIWNIFNSGKTPDTAGSNAWLVLAQNQNFLGYDFSKFRILTPLDRSSKGPQENLTTVPEPTTMLLFGTGITAIAAKVRRRRAII
jgi:hypothetical protein